METGNSFARIKSSRHASPFFSRWLALPSCVALCLLLCSAPLFAQGKSGAARPVRLPSPERVVGDYLKAVGGKKRIAAIKDAAYQWTIRLGEQELGEARTQVKAPTSARTDMLFGNGEINAAANTSS